MLRRHQLRSHHCVPDLIRIVDQIGLRAAARAPLFVDMPIVAMLLLWTILRDERTWLLLSLEETGIDMWRLTCDVDALLNQEKTHGEVEGVLAAGQSPQKAETTVDPFLSAWLVRAEQEAQMLGHHYLGVEHLLLAIGAEVEPPLAALLARYELTYARLRQVITAALIRLPPPQVPEILETYKPWGAAWDKPAIGVPRRYTLAMILGMMAVYAVLFAALRVADAHAAVFILVTVFFTGVSLGQPLLFGGRYPRAAAMWIGGALVPIEGIAAIICIAIAGGRVPSLGEFVCAAVGLSIAGIPAGVLLGYLLGCIGAGLFLLMDLYETKKQRSSPPPEAAAFDPFLKDDSPPSSADSVGPPASHN